MNKTAKASLVALAFAAGFANADQARWYGEQQVAQGKQLFQENCASCHGQQGQGAPNWREPAPDVSPAPPLNGSGHAWHHPLNILSRQIQTGGAPVGGRMPPFSGKLDEAQTQAVIAYFQSLWSDEIYSAWLARGGLPNSTSSAKVKSDDPATRYLRKRARGRTLGEPMESAVSGIKRIKLGADYLYVTSDGRYVFTGALVDLKTGRNLTQELLKSDVRDALDAVPDSDKVVFKAEGEEKAVIDVFTDTSCPYCKKLHKEVPQLQAAGVTVRYLPYPRGGKNGPGYEGLKQVWCAKDRAKAMDDAKSGLAMAAAPANCDQARVVDQGFKLGGKLKIKGTPAIFLPDGRLINGYVPATKLLPQLGLR